MRKITAITQFIQEVSALIDRGFSYPIELVREHIENKDVIDWLKQESKDIAGVCFSIFDNETEKENIEFIHNKLYDYFCGYYGDEKRKWGITNNGLCLLISWSTEIIRDIYGRV